MWSNHQEPTKDEFFSLHQTKCYFIWPFWTKPINISQERHQSMHKTFSIIVLKEEKTTGENLHLLRAAFWNQGVPQGVRTINGKDIVTLRTTGTGILLVQPYFKWWGEKKTMNDISCKSFLWEHFTKDIKNACAEGPHHRSMGGQTVTPSTCWESWAAVLTFQVPLHSLGIVISFI